jgi:protein-tyrosine phosphatase
MKTVLFLCSGNYYRSRFAEHYFNWLAVQHDLRWQADSRGLHVGRAGNIGPISCYAREGLQSRGVLLNGHCRLPKQVLEDDLAQADLVIAVKEAEHRPAMADLFPQWVERIRYWHVDDLDCAEPVETLTQLEEQLRALATNLAAIRH